MSFLKGYKLSTRYLFINSLCILLGIFVGSVFIRISNISVLEQFSERYLSFYDDMTFTGAISILVKEYLVFAIIFVCSFFPYGQFAAVSSLFYKGFCIGIVCAIACWQLKTGGIKYMFFMIFPQNFIYGIALCLMAQITFDRISIGDTTGKHSMLSKQKYPYFLAATIELLGVLTETIALPALYKIIF